MSALGFSSLKVPSFTSAVFQDSNLLEFSTSYPAFEAAQYEKTLQGRIINSLSVAAVGSFILVACQTMKVALPALLMSGILLLVLAGAVVAGSICYRLFAVSENNQRGQISYCRELEERYRRAIGNADKQTTQAIESLNKEYQKQCEMLSNRLAPEVSVVKA